MRTHRRMRVRQSSTLTHLQFFARATLILHNIIYRLTIAIGLLYNPKFGLSSRAASYNNYWDTFTRRPTVKKRGTYLKFWHFSRKYDLFYQKLVIYIPNSIVRLRRFFQQTYTINFRIFYHYFSNKTYCFKHSNIIILIKTVCVFECVS